MTTPHAGPAAPGTRCHARPGHGTLACPRGTWQVTERTSDPREA